MIQTRWMPMAVGVALSLSACDTMHVRSDSDAASSVSTCHSYGWLETPASTARPSAFENPINDKRLRSAIAKRLASRGLTLVDAGASGDCLVSYAIGSRQTIVGNAGPRWNFGFGTGYGGWGNRSAASIGWSSEPYAYREGRIAVDLYRTAGREPIWHAAADVDVSQLTGADAETRIDAAVAAIFDRYPGGR